MKSTDADILVVAGHEGPGDAHWQSRLIAKLSAARLVERAKGGFLVAPPNEQSLRALKGIDPKFVPIPRDPLPFPSALIASSNDPHSSLEDSSDLALAWGSKLIEAGAAGHINTQSGHGPWPEGMMSFAGFISRLPA